MNPKQKLQNLRDALQAKRDVIEEQRKQRYYELNEFVSPVFAALTDVAYDITLLDSGHSTPKKLAYFLQAANFQRPSDTEAVWILQYHNNEDNQANLLKIEARLPGRTYAYTIGTRIDDALPRKQNENAERQKEYEEALTYYKQQLQQYTERQKNSEAPRISGGEEMMFRRFMGPWFIEDYSPRMPREPQKPALLDLGAKGSPVNAAGKHIAVTLKHGNSDIVTRYVFHNPDIRPSCFEFILELLVTAEDTRPLKPTKTAEKPPLKIPGFEAGL